MKQNWESRKDLHTQCSKLKILRFLWFQSYQILGMIFPNLSNQSLVPLVQFKPQLLIFWPLFSLTSNLVSTLPDVSKIDLNMPVLERTVLSLPRGPYPSPQKFSEGSLGPCLFSSWGAVGEGGTRVTHQCDWEKDCEHKDLRRIQHSGWCLSPPTLTLLGRTRGRSQNLASKSNSRAHLSVPWVRVSLHTDGWGNATLQTQSLHPRI